MTTAFASPLSIGTGRTRFATNAVNRPSAKNVLAAQAASRRATCMSIAVTAPDFTNGPVLLGKAGPNGELGDCPFTQKVNLSLRARGVDFNMALVDLSDKPEWFLDLSDDASTPAYVDEALGKVLTSSDEIVEHADEVGTKGSKLYAEDNEHWDNAFQVISPLFKAFVTYVKSKEKTDKVELDHVISRINAHLCLVPGRFVISDEISALDANLAPKMHHIMVAGKHHLGYDLPWHCAVLREYMENMMSTEEWKATAYPDETTIWGWSKFF